MKRLKLLLLILTIGCTAFSQDLAPQVQVVNNDTLFCFTIPQSKEIAKKIEAGTSCDSVLIAQDTMIELLNQSLVVQDSLNTQLRQKLKNLETIQQNQQDNITYLQTSLDQKDEKLRKGKVHKVLLGIGIVLISVVAITN